MNLEIAIQELSNDILLIVALPIFLIAVAAEWYYEKYKELEIYKGKDFLASLSMFSRVVGCDMSGLKPPV